mmetsp:Transcript_6946/g.12360  ORF Transcript_6946/g.12360 Transcript_6946/m.12360 type:complete len:217 (+) Transcript_6946:939-1589(+)
MQVNLIKIPELWSTIVHPRSSSPGPSVIERSKAIFALAPYMLRHAALGSTAKQSLATSAFFDSSAVPLNVVNTNFSITPRSPISMEASKESVVYISMDATGARSQRGWQGLPYAPTSAPNLILLASALFHSHWFPAWSFCVAQTDGLALQLFVRDSQRIHLSRLPSKAEHSGSPQHEHCLQHSCSVSSTATVKVSFPLLVGSLSHLARWSGSSMSQ